MKFLAVSNRRLELKSWLSEALAYIKTFSDLIREGYFFVGR